MILQSDPVTKLSDLVPLVKEGAPLFNPTTDPQTVFYGAMFVLVIVIAGIFVRLYIKSSEKRAEFSEKHNETQNKVLTTLNSIQVAAESSAETLKEVKADLKKMEEKMLTLDKELNEKIIKLHTQILTIKNDVDNLKQLTGGQKNG